MDCNKTNMKHFNAGRRLKCLQGAAIKSKHYDRPLFEAIYAISRTDYKLVILVCWGTLHCSYNCNEYHAIFQISVHNNSPKWYIRLISEVFYVWLCM